MNYKTLKIILEDIYKEYHDPALLRLDPLEFVYNFKSKENKEIAGLVCSVLAYGKVEQIRKSIANVFTSTGKDLVTFCTDVSLQEKKKLFSAFKHRFNDGDDIAILFECVGLARKKYGSLEKMFCSGLNDADETIKTALSHFAMSMRDMARVLYKRDKSTFDFFFPAPSCGSTCKRLTMFLRWMVRHNDAIDLGLWKNVSPAKLIIPVDTHVAAVSRKYGLTKRNTVDWRMAEEITSILRILCPEDPVRYDFSLCHSGMVDFRKIRT